MNENLKCILIDDEENGRDVLRNLIVSYCQGVTIVAEAANITSAAQLIKLNNPDFIVLDILMPGGTGFQLLQSLPEINFEVIFVSSYDKYAIQAFKFSAVDYLLKPVEIDDLLRAIDRVRSRVHLNQKRGFDQYSKLIQNLNNESEHQVLTVQKGDHVLFIDVKDILYLEAESNYTHLATFNGEKYILSKTLRYYEELFHLIPFLIRVNRSFIVNIRALRSYSKTEPTVISLINGLEIEIGRRKKTELLNLVSTLKL